MAGSAGRRRRLLALVRCPILTHCDKRDQGDRQSDQGETAADPAEDEQCFRRWITVQREEHGEHCQMLTGARDRRTVRR